MKPNILVVEDEPHLAQGIADNLVAEGYDVCVVGDGQAALNLDPGLFSLVVLDVMLPKCNGYTVCRRLRSAGATLPILFLSAKNSSDERVEGLHAGGDDYLGKPFDLRELLLRVRAMLRRQAPGRREAPAPYELAGCHIDFAQHVVIGPEGRAQSLPPRELQLLEAFVQRPHQVLSRAVLLEKVWGHDVYPSSRSMEGFVERLRQRFEPNPAQPRYFHTVAGEGYLFTPETPSSDVAPHRAAKGFI
jgi:two-component system alkaline phosphatase synthesis response regulator PhoP